MGKIKFSDTEYQASSLGCIKYCASVLETVTFVFLLGPYVTLPFSVAPSVSVLQLCGFLLQMKFVNIQMF
jgi:hypothetical protein